MKIITFHNEFQLAIFKVGNALHITVRRGQNNVTIGHFNSTTAVTLQALNYFSKTFDKLPTEWHEREIRCQMDNSKTILILIIK